MMYVEDLIYQLYINCKVNRYDSAVLSSFSNQIHSGMGFTEKQSLLAIKLLTRYKSSLSTFIQQDVTIFLENPTFKFQIRKPNTHKKVSIIDHPIWHKAIQLEFPFNQEQVDIIRKNKENLQFVVWDHDKKSWLFALHEKNLLFVSKFIADQDYEIDEEFKNYHDQIMEILNSIEHHIPTIHSTSNTLSYRNASKEIPKIQSTEILPALFEARKYGIFTWNDEINEYLNAINLNPVVRTFLSNENAYVLEIDSQQNAIECLADIVKYTQPTLFIIPGGSELEKTKMIYDFLIRLNYNHNDMSVMFRLSNQNGKEFNDFVKNHNLNNPINEKTKFVFVSIRLPKPVISSKIKFNSVISLGRSNVHYTIRDFFKNRQNLIFYCEPSKQKEFNFNEL